MNRELLASNIYAKAMVTAQRILRADLNRANKAHEKRVERARTAYARALKELREEAA